MRGSWLLLFGSLLILLFTCFDRNPSDKRPSLHPEIIPNSKEEMAIRRPSAVTEHNSQDPDPTTVTAQSTTVDKTAAKAAYKQLSPEREAAVIEQSLLEIRMLRELGRRQGVDIRKELAAAHSRRTILQSPIPRAAKKLRGVVHTFYKDGTLKTVSFYIDGVKTGREYEFFSKGPLKRNTYWDKGRRSGVEKEWAIGGEVMRETPYIKGKVQGIEVLFYIGGVNRLVRPWDKGRRHGTEREFYEFGAPKRVVAWDRGFRVGKEISFHPDGSILQVSFFSKGRKEGEEKEYWPNGVLKRTVWFEKSKKMGIEYFYDSSARELKRLRYDGRSAKGVVVK